MPCPDPSALEAFALGNAPAAERHALESHLDGCAECSEVVAQLAQIYGPSAATRSFLDPGEPPHVGGMVGRYRLGRRLGAGGMGVVYEAHDPELDRLVAIKLLHGGSHALALKTRLLREARAMARLAHPNVVAVHDVGTIGRQVFIAMELVEGSTLSQWMRTAPRSRGEVLRVMIEAGRGLEAAHRVGMVHRDFKPDNVLLGADGRARVTDFGLARPEEVPEAHAVSTPTRPPHEIGVSLTRTAPGSIVGTPAYMAPEQLRALPADARSDQFAFCVVLHEALFGKRPYDGASFQELRDNVLLDRRVPMPTSAPRWLRELLDRGLSLDPARRHLSMTELLAELERDRGRVRRVALSLAAMATGAAAMVAALYVWMVPSGSEGAASPAVEASDPACEERSLLGERWTESRRAELTRALGERAYLLAPDATHALAAFDAFAAAWTVEHERLCSEDDEGERARRRTCLERRFREFDGLLSHLIDEKDASAVERAFSAAAHLPRPDECASAARRAVQPKDPDDPDELAKVALLRSDLSALGAKLALGQAMYQTKRAAELVEEARALDHPALIADALLLQGRLLLRLGHTDDAGKQLEAAAAMARTAGHDEAITAAAFSLVAVETERLRPKAATRWLRILKSDATRFDDELLAAAVTLLEADMHRAIGEYAEARKLHERALDTRKKRLGEDHVLVAEARIALSEVLLDLEQPRDALAHAKEALRVAQALTGKDSLEVAAAEAALGHALLAQAKHRDALEHLERASHLQVLGLRHDGREPANLSLELIAEAREALSESEAADKALASSALGREESPRYARALAKRADVLTARGDLGEAAKLHRQAVAHLEGFFGDHDPRLVAALRGLGRAEARAGHLAEARRVLERAAAIVSESVGYEPLLAFVHDDLAFVARQAKNARAELAHLDEAHVLTSSAYGHDHPHIARKVLARADLAWDLGDREYAARLYGGVKRRLAEHLGPEHPDAVRARTRAAPEKEEPARRGPTAAEIKAEIMKRVREKSR